MLFEKMPSRVSKIPSLLVRHCDVMCTMSKFLMCISARSPMHLFSSPGWEVRPCSLFAAMTLAEY